MEIVSEPQRLGAWALLWGLAALGCNGVGQPTDEAARSGDACAQLAKQICGQTPSDASLTCVDVRASIELLTADTCKVALAHPDYSSRALSRRELNCDALRGKLCADTSSVPKSCDRVKQNTKRFSDERCKEMLGRYDEVLVDLKQGLKMPSF